MNTLISVTGLEARILHLPGRPPCMTSTDLAEAYDTSVKALNQAVKRNPDRFPEDFMFILTEAESEALKSQNVTSNKANRALPLAFTHAGALALSGVLKTERAAQVSVIVHRAFAAMEQQAFAAVKHRLDRLASEARGRRPIRSRIVDAAREGWTFEQLWADTRHSKKQLARHMADCMALGLIDVPLPGAPMQAALQLPLAMGQEGGAA